MTSAATRKKPAHRLVAPRRVGGSGFTLLEVSLAMLLLVLLFSLTVVNLAGWGRAQRLEEGAQRFQTLLGMARADAANLGRRLRLAFEAGDSQAGQIRLLLEADPLTAPQQFTDYLACTWAYQVPNELVEVVSCQRLGDSAYRLTETEQAEQDDPSRANLDEMTFYPDGTCDSALIELASAADSRRAVIQIDGLTGASTCRILTTAELAEQE